MANRPAGERRGRPRQDEVASRQTAMLDAALDVLADYGYQGFTVAAVADRARSSKSTIYSWFENRDGLLRAAVEHHYRPAILAITPDYDKQPAEVLYGFARNLLELLNTRRSLALARVVMTNPQVQDAVLASGGDRGRRHLADYLQHLDSLGALSTPDSMTASKAFYGLTVQDSQMRSLYGDPLLTPEEIAERAEFAVDAFLRLYAAPATS